MKSERGYVGADALKWSMSGTLVISPISGFLVLFVFVGYPFCTKDSLSVGS